MGRSNGCGRIRWLQPLRDGRGSVRRGRRLLSFSRQWYHQIMPIHSDIAAGEDDALADWQRLERCARVGWEL